MTSEQVKTTQIVRLALHDATEYAKRPMHRLKCWPQFFEPIKRGEKTHDLRRADDRDFEVGDRMLLEEFDPRTKSYSGRRLVVEITFITSASQPCALSDKALASNYCILSIKLTN
jgi:hypothetical protein